MMQNTTERISNRDFAGYGGTPPNPQWPDGARVAVSLVVNFEEGAEYSVSDGDAFNEATYEVVDRVDGPDSCIDSHFEYGTRAAWWRIMRLFDEHKVKVTVSSCGRAVERLPEFARDAVARGHELSAHGWRWTSHLGMQEDCERKVIARTVAAIERATGQRPVGWHTRSATSPNTRRLLVEHGGFLYDSDAYNDDLPYYTNVGGKRHLVLPYSFDTNDMQYLNAGRFQGRDFANYVIDAFEWLKHEGATAPKMMSIGLHLRMIGRPGRIGALQSILSHINESGAAWIAPRVAIAKHWMTRFPVQS
jgi:peptidoglycan/xylan/chitin deacetylase (PgdA/CDA1 family)